MELKDLIYRFSNGPDNQRKAIFSTLFIAGNRLQTLFDSRIPSLSLKQFMLLSIVRQADVHLTFTQLGEILGCSRQNVKKLATALEKKGFVTIWQNPNDLRAYSVFSTPKANEYFENEFSGYLEEMKQLFSVYTDEELAQLFRLLMKLYDGIERLETAIGEDGE